MTINNFHLSLSETLSSETPARPDFDRLASALVDAYESSDQQFKQHIMDRCNRVAARTGQQLDPANFDISGARSLIADEIGFSSWDELIEKVEDRTDGEEPLLFHYAVAAMDMGNFTALEQTLGGSERFDPVVRDWLEKGLFDDHPDTLAEIFAAACMLGHASAVEFLLDHGVDPYAGMKTGLAGFHYAASSGRVDIVKLLIDRGVPAEVKNIYGGTVFGQAIWSAVNEHKPSHAEIIRMLVEAGAEVDPGYQEWWQQQAVPDPATKAAIADTLERHKQFQARLGSIREQVAVASQNGDDLERAAALRRLADVERRQRLLRDTALETYSEAADIYRNLRMPLDEAWVIRHIGIIHEYAERLDDAEMCYDESLALYRDNTTVNTLDYANTVRYPAVIKERLGKRDESALLWEEAARRYYEAEAPVGVAEAAAHMALFAIESGDKDSAASWFDKAKAAARLAKDNDTDKFIDDVGTRLSTCFG